MVMVSSLSFAVDSILWQTLPTARGYQLDGTTLITANQTLSTVGGFVQLLYLGADGIYNGFINSGTGVVGDDVVAQTTWFGVGAMGRAGEFVSSATVSTIIGSKYEIRFFDTPAASYPGSVPTTGYYGLSQVFSQTGDPDVGGVDTFSFNANYSATIAVVPEPSTVALMLAGLGVLGFARMRRK